MAELNDRSVIRWGILGAGPMAHGFAEGLRWVRSSRVVAVASRRRDRAEILARRARAARVHDDVDALAADPEVDVVYIATPNDRHAADTLACVSVGTAVLCEKPFTLDAAESRIVVDSARRAGVFVMEAMWMRTLPAVRGLVDLLGRGTIGEIRSVHADFSMPVPADPADRRFDPAAGGGALLDLGVYPLSFVDLVLGPVDEVLDVEMASTPTGVDESVLAVTRHGSALAVSTASLGSDGPGGATVGGTTGSIRLDGPICRPTRLTVVHGGPGSPRRRTETLRFPVMGVGYAHEAIEVVRCLRAGRTESTVMPLDASLRVMELVDLVRHRASQRA